MKPYSVQFVLGRKMIQIKVVEKITTNILGPIVFSTIVEKYCTAGENTDNNIIWSVSFSCRILNVRIQTHLRNIGLLLFCPPTIFTRTHISVRVNVQCLS
jgi:hypothetical protein